MCTWYPFSRDKLAELSDELFLCFSPINKVAYFPKRRALLVWRVHAEHDAPSIRDLAMPFSKARYKLFENLSCIVCLVCSLYNTLLICMGRGICDLWFSRTLVQGRHLLEKDDKLSTNGRCLKPLSRDTGRQFSCVVLCLPCYTFPILGGRVQAW